MDPHGLNSMVGHDAKLRGKHQVLLQEYLLLQKECVSKKRKLKESNKRKVTLLEEIRFLKHRRDLLLKRQSQNSEQTQESAQPHKTIAKTNAETNRRYLNGTAGASTSSSGQAVHHPGPPMIPIRKMGSGNKEEVAFAPLNSRNNPKSLFNNGKRAEKKENFVARSAGVEGLILI